MFNHFDKLTTAHRVYRVETIGDAYFACSGVVNQQSFHTADLVSFALSCQRAIRHLKTSDGQNGRIRIGLHTGPVIAGVVGRKMPRYHLFGKTVSIAEQYESQGIPDKVVVSRATMDAVQVPICPKVFDWELLATMLKSTEANSTERWLVKEATVHHHHKSHHHHHHDHTQVFSIPNSIQPASENSVEVKSVRGMDLRNASDNAADPSSPYPTEGALLLPNAGDKTEGEWGPQPLLSDRKDLLDLPSAPPKSDHSSLTGNLMSLRTDQRIEETTLGENDYGDSALGFGDTSSDLVPLAALSSEL
jgi:hypothetical protein